VVCTLREKQPAFRAITAGRSGRRSATKHLSSLELSMYILSVWVKLIFTINVFLLSLCITILSRFSRMLINVINKCYFVSCGLSSRHLWRKKQTIHAAWTTIARCTSRSRVMFKKVACLLLSSIIPEIPSLPTSESMDSHFCYITKLLYYYIMFHTSDFIY